MISGFKELYAFRDMVAELVHRELRGKYKGSVLGFLWTYVNPLAQIIVYAFFFSHIFKSGIEKFYLYLIVSMFPWNAFTGGVLQGLGSIRYQGDLVKKVYFPRRILPMVSVTVNFINMLISFLIIYGMLLVSGWEVNLSLQLWLVPVILVEFLFTLGLALLLSAVEVYFRDIEHITAVIMMVWMYVTPMFYNLDFLPEEFKGAFLWNPMLYMIGMYQQVLYYHVAPDAAYMLRGGLTAIGMFVVGWLVFGCLEKRFAEEL